MTSIQSFNLSFPLLFHVISTAILKSLPWFPASPPWFPTFFYFHPDSPHSHADSPYPHSHTIPRIPMLLFRNFLILFQFPILAFTNTLLGLYSFSIYFRKIVTSVQKRTLPFFYYCITLGIKLLFTSYMMSSVLSPKIIYLIVPQVKNL